VREEIQLSIPLVHENSRVASFCAIGDHCSGHRVSFIIALSAARESHLSVRGVSLTMRIRARFYQRILHNPCALAALEFGRICRTTASSDNGVNGHPTGVTQRRYRRLLERRQDSKKAGRSSTMDVEQQPNLLAAESHPAAIISGFLLFALPGIGSCGQGS